VVPDQSRLALTENGNVKRGRAMTERGFAMREANANAVHALLHAMFEDGSVADADALVNALDSNLPAQRHSAWPYPLAPGPRRARTWRRGTGAFDLCRGAAALCHPRAAAERRHDGASLLWRLQAYGHAVPGTLWSEADAFAQRAFRARAFPFADCIWRCSRRPPATRPHSASGLP